jgi:hypothetical protein
VELPTVLSIHEFCSSRFFNYKKGRTSLCPAQVKRPLVRTDQEISRKFRKTKTGRVEDNPQSQGSLLILFLLPFPHKPLGTQQVMKRKSSKGLRG